MRDHPLGGAEAHIACPHCGRPNEFHQSDEASKVPKDGDVSICWGCKEISVYVNGPLGLAQREPSEKERAEISADPQVRAALGAMRESYDPATAVALWRGDGGG